MIRCRCTSCQVQRSRPDAERRQLTVGRDGATAGNVTVDPTGERQWCTVPPQVVATFDLRAPPRRSAGCRPKGPFSVAIEGLGLLSVIVSVEMPLASWSTD